MDWQILHLVANLHTNMQTNTQTTAKKHTRLNKKESLSYSEEVGQELCLLA